MSHVIESAYQYLDEIQEYLSGEMSKDRLRRMLVSMANEGIAWKLTGDLRAEFEAMLADGRIVGIIQNAWDDLNDRIDPCCMEKIYVTGERAKEFRS